MPPAIMSAVIAGVTVAIKPERDEIKDSVKENTDSVTENTALQIHSILTSSSAVFSPDIVTVSRSALRQAAIIRRPSKTAKFFVASGTAAAMILSPASEKKLKLNALYISEASVSNRSFGRYSSTSFGTVMLILFSFSSAVSAA